MTSTPLLNHLLMIVIKMVLMLPVAGLAYEFIKVCSLRMQNPIFHALIWPGLILQKLTTRNPGDDQLEVALASLKQVLRLEKVRNESFSIEKDQREFEIMGLSELGQVEAQVAEFPEN